MQQTWSANGYAENGRFVADLGSPLLNLLAAQAGERILDLGCGDGALTEKVAATGALVVGVDTSEELLHAARSRGLDLRAMDAQRLSFHTEFDTVFSNAALHWMKRPEDVLRGVQRALKPAGRFVANLEAMETSLRFTPPCLPFFPDAESIWRRSYCSFLRPLNIRRCLRGMVFT